MLKVELDSYGRFHSADGGATAEASGESKPIQREDEKHMVSDGTLGFVGGVELGIGQI